MTAAARITQDDIKRTLKSIVNDAGIDRARIILRLEKSEIEIIIGEPEPPEPAPPPITGNPWDGLINK